MAFISEFVKMVCDLPGLLYTTGISKELPFTEQSVVKNDEVFPSFQIATDLEETDAAVLVWLRNKMQQLEVPEVTLISGLLNRKLYKRLWSISLEGDDRTWRQIIKKWDELSIEKRSRVSYEFEKAIANKIVSPAATTALSADDAKARIDQATAAHNPWLLVDVPGARPGSEMGLYCVLESQGRRLRKDDHVVGELQRSEVWDRYARDLRIAAGTIRIFCMQELVDTVEATISSEIGIEELIGVLERL